MDEAADYSSSPADIPENGLDRISHLIGAWDILWIDAVKCNAKINLKTEALLADGIRALSNTH
jgi:hypothetical protein